MNALNELTALYEQYQREVDAVIKKAKPTDGILGFGHGPKDDPCHERFIHSFTDLIGRSVLEGVSAEEADGLLSYIFEAQQKEKTFVYWSMIAVHGEAMPLISFLTKERASEMLDQYQAMFPQNHRLPVQDKIVDALARQAGREPVRRKRFPWSRG